MSSMFAASSGEGPHGQNRGRVVTRCGPKVDKKAKSTVTLPSLCPKPHSLSKPPLTISDAPPERTSAVVELPHLISQVGSKRATNDTKWAEGLQLTASAIGAQLPFSLAAAAGVSSKRLTESDEKLIKASTCKTEKIAAAKGERASKLNESALTGTGVLQQGPRADFEFYSLKEVNGNTYRPYDLQVVDSSEAGSEHFIFSRNSVLHVTENGCGGLVSLAEWHRESVLWTMLQEIPFFRDFRLRKAFTWWNRNVRRIFFQCRREALQNTLLMDVPQFRGALRVFASLIEDLKETCWLHQEENQGYTLMEFNKTLTTKSQECLHILAKLSRCRILILNEVKDICHKEHRELLLHMQHAQKPNKCHEPICHHLAHQQQLKKELARSEHVLQKLGNFGSLVNLMTVQSVASFISQNTSLFLSKVLKKPQQCGLFHTELCLDAGGQLTVEPPVRLFKEAVCEALRTFGNSIVEVEKVGAALHEMCLLRISLTSPYSDTDDKQTSQKCGLLNVCVCNRAKGSRMCERCGFFSEISSSVLGSDFGQDLKTHLRCIQPPSVKEVSCNSDGSSGCRKFCCWQMLRDQSAQRPLLPKQSLLMMQGSMVHRCYNPLSKTQLEWQISSSDPSEQVGKEEDKVMTAAEVEVQQLCEDYRWLGDICVFICEWWSDSEESMQGQPALQCEEHLQKIRKWTEKIKSIPSSIFTSNQLFIIHFTSTKETLERQLSLIEEEIVEQLRKQTALLSEGLILDLEKATSELKKDPQGLNDLSKYALKMREYSKMPSDVQKRLELIHSLQDIICKNYGGKTEQELTLEKKMLGLWDCFIPLLEEADTTVHHRLPSAANALDKMVSFTDCNLKSVLSEASSGPHLDPSQNARKMVSKLNSTCAHVHALSAKMEQLNANSQNLQDCVMDLTLMTTNIQKVTALKELWELRAECTKWMEEWRQMLFSQVDLSQAQEKIARWKEQTHTLSSILSPCDAVLQDTLEILEKFHNHLAVMAPLWSPTLKHKHRRTIFKGLGLLCVPEKVTVAKLMSVQLEVQRKLIAKICTDAQAEWDMEQTFHELQQRWNDSLFQLDEFTLPICQHYQLQPGLAETERPKKGTVSKLQTATRHSSNEARFTISGFDKHFAEIDNSVMILSTMLKFPYSLDNSKQMEDWLHSLQELEKLLDLFERYQQSWVFLTKMFNETFFVVQRGDLLQQFKPVDKAFKEIMQTMSLDSHVLSLVHCMKTNERFSGSNLGQILTSGLTTMDAISSQMAEALDALRKLFPRLWFLSDREVRQLHSCQPTPSRLQASVRKCFKGVHCLDIDGEKQSISGNSKTPESGNHAQTKVLGLFSSLKEHISFISPLEHNPATNTCVWLSKFEKKLKLTIEHLIKNCAVVLNNVQPSSQIIKCDKKIADNLDTRRKIIAPVLDLLAEYPLQCVLLAEEAKWCQVVCQVFKEKCPKRLNNIKAYNSEKMKNLYHAMRDIVPEKEFPVSRYIMVCICALVQLTMNHTQQLAKLMECECELESSFEWLSLLKYHVNSDDQNLKVSDNPTCYVDVFGHHFPYGYEYIGPEDWVMAHTPSTDRAVLGILLAVRSYKCGHVTGPCMSGKTKTVVQLGRALGRHVVTVQCSPSMRPCVVQQMLFGALQTGAWVLLESVDLLTEEVMSLLGQHLLDIHQSFCGITKWSGEHINMTTAGNIGCTTFDLAGKTISANLGYGCVLISSQGYTSDIPQCLRFATRPVALTHPDYRIIAEVMLTSLGFSDAMALSHRLVSLISLLKDSLCMPDFITGYRSCYLIVLQKIVSVSEKYFKESARQQEISNEAKRLAAGKKHLTLFQNVSVTDEKGHSESEGSSRLNSSHLIKQSLMEEMAIVKGILSVLLPALHDQKKASQFYMILKDSFPIVSQFPHFQRHFDGGEQSLLKDAVTEELQRRGLHTDAESICDTLTLHQAMRFSQTVLLIGPSGSRKTTCYSSLAGALNSLSAKEAEFVLENDHQTKGDPTVADPHAFTSNWKPVDTVVLFPNAMPHHELFGHFCDKRGWQDGAVPNVLRCSERTSELCIKEQKQDHTAAVNWLVLDGEPMGHPGWLDSLATLCDPENPFLFLPSGEELVPSQSHLKLLMEITDLSDASPSAVTRCSLVHFTGANVWKAVWKTEMNALYCDLTLDQGTINMWNCLSEDLFPSTIALLREKALKSAVHCHGEYFKLPTHGLQEIMSFMRIFSAFLQHFTNDLEKAEETQTSKRDIPQQEQYIPGINGKLLARNIFLLAFVWGFGGHLHPRHWTHFDSLIRQVLLSCRYKIVVPDETTVFEHFFIVDCKTLPLNTLSATSISPKQGKYAYLLSLMLEANQPVLLAGESGTGKTTLCQSLLRFDKPHISLPASPLVSYRELRIILKNISCQRFCKDAARSGTKQQRLLLFVDDLHESPCDAFGKSSTALESMRQSISKGAILTFDDNHFNLLKCAKISYLATCHVSGSSNHHNNVPVTSRLSRLFSIFVLPSQSAEIIFSIHSPRLQVWLKGILHQSSEDLTRGIITATKSLYHAACDQFQSTLQRSCFMFSHRDLQKVFEGIYLWQPDIQDTGKMQKMDYALPRFTESMVSVLDIAHLWMHECMRTFGDRLRTERERTTLVSLIAKVATTHFGMKLDETHPDNTDVPPTATNSILPTDTADGCKRIHQDTLPKTHLSENTFSVKENPSTHPSILQYMETIVDELAYGPELSEALNSIDQRHSSKHNYDYKKLDIDAFVQQLSALMDRNEVAENCMGAFRYMVHRERVSQLLHIVRVLLLPGGHGALISSGGGTGRRTAVRLAAHLTGYQLMEVHSRNENKLHEILKEAGDQTRVDGGNVIVLVHEDVSYARRDELLTAMAHGAYPAVHTVEELNDLVSRATSVKKSKRYLMDSWMLNRYLSQVHRNVHVFLLMSSIMSDSGNETHVRNRQMTKALSLSCCVEVFQPWSRQSLVEVASYCFKTRNSEFKRESLVVSLSATIAGIHQSACQYATVLLTWQPFSPQTFMECLDHLDFLMNHLHKQCQGRVNRISSVLSALNSLNDASMRNKQHIENLREKLAATEQHEEGLLRAVADQKCVLEEAQNQCAVEKNTITELEEQLKHVQKRVRSVFLSGIEILKCLNPSDLEEVRRYRNPPDGVVMVMDAVCLLFDRPQGWENAKQLIGQSNFFQELEFFDRFSLIDEQLQQLGQIVSSPQFVPESVREVSKACESLCRWVQAVYECCCMRQQLLVKQQLERLDKEARARLYLAKQSKADAHRCLVDLKLQLQVVRKDLEKLQQELHKAEDGDREASITAEQLAGHVRDWRAAAQAEKSHNENLPGDSLILAAIITYLGPFLPDTRTELLLKWRELCQTGSISLNPKDPRSSLFTTPEPSPNLPPLGFPIPVSERLEVAVGRALGMKAWQLHNTASARLVVHLLLWAHRNLLAQRWPLLVDMQQRQEMGSQSWFITGDSVMRDEEYGMVISADDPELLDKVDGAAQKGLKVLVTHVELAVSSLPFLAGLAPLAGCCPPGLKQHTLPPHPDFRLFLSTDLPVRLFSSAIRPSVLALAHVVDLCPSTDEIQELMLTQLLQSECKEVLIRHKRLQNHKHELEEEVVAQDDALIDYISRTTPSLRQHCDFRCNIAVFQKQMKTLQDEIVLVNGELEYHETLVSALRQLVRLAAALYQALQEVSVLSPAYFFSLRDFIIFVQDTFIVKGRPLVSHIIGEVPEGIVPEVTNRMVTQLLLQYRPLLFKRHFAVLKLLVCMALLQHNQLCSEGERVAFIRGLQDMEEPGFKDKSASQSTASLPSWIPSNIHAELLHLESIPAFRGLISSLTASPVQWQEYLSSPSSTVVGAVPCHSHCHLSLLQRALLWKTIHPTCLNELADVLTSCQLCLPVQTAGSEAPHSGNPDSLSRYLVKQEGPIILTLPCPGEESWTSIQPHRLINTLADCAAVEGKTQEVKFLSFGARCDVALILAALEKAATDGHWLVFSDCHLWERWDTNIVNRLFHLMSSLNGQRFLLWFITHEGALHGIPATVRVRALPLVCDSPWDVKEELSCSVQHAMPVRRRQPLSAETRNNVEFLLRCAIFHSVLLQRQRCKHTTGQGKTYNWNQDDLLALVDAHNSIVSCCQNRTKALRCIAGSLVHGGHVRDSADLEVLESVAEVCLSRASPLWSRQSHVFSEILNDTDEFDLSQLLQILKQGLQDSASMSDPLALGYSVDVAVQMIKVNSQKLNILLRASQTPRRTVDTQLKQQFVVPPYSHIQDRLQALQNVLAGKKSGVKNAGAVSQSPLRDFLRAERDELIDTVSSLLSRLRQPVQHTQSTPLSFIGLTDLSLLERRAELLQAYVTHDKSSDPPGAYRLSAFSNARGFLVAVLREAAQVNRKYVSDFKLHFQVLTESEYPASPPLDAVYLCGLELRGASWDTQLGTLQDTVTSQPCTLPPVCVTAQVRSRHSSRDVVPSCNGSYLLDLNNVQISEAPTSTAYQLPVYHCPLYLDEEQRSGDWGLAHVDVITQVPLYTQLNPVSCRLRRVRLVSLL